MSLFWYLLVMAGVTYLIRMLPLTLLQKKIRNRRLQSFLYYVPYVTLAVMTFPAIIDATQSPISGWLALLIGIFAAWKGAGLFKVALSCCVIVFAAELFLV